jgi:hypothetical protein
MVLVTFAETKVTRARGGTRVIDFQSIAGAIPQGYGVVTQGIWKIQIDK